MGDDEVVKIWSNKQVILKEYVNYDTSPTESNMCIRTSSLKSNIVGGSMAILLKNLYLSCDPSMRIRMMKLEGSFPHSFKPGSRLSSFGVGKVIGSGHPKFKEGDLVWGRTGWEEYTLIDDHSQLQDMFIIDQHYHDIPLSYYTGILGISGITAYAGFYEVCKPKKGESVFVSAASGAVGQLVGQFAKLLGCYVVGSAGSNQKVDLLKRELGYDEAFNYKEEQCLYAALKRYFPKGIDIYFDNVGGKMLDAVIANMRPHGRIAICGMISQYKSESQSERIHNLACLILNRIRMEGFLATEYYHLYPKFHQFVVELIRDKKIVYMEDVALGLENGPSAFLRLFSGLNIGKQLIQVASHHP